MLNTFDAENFSTEDGKPAGGYVSGVGLDINWQNGPLGRGEDREAPNGAFVETVLEAVKQRIEYYQTLQFNCAENQWAIHHINEALLHLRARTARREQQGTEGTWEGN